MVERRGPMGGPIESFIDWSDERLEREIRRLGLQTAIPYEGLLAELNRRADNRQARAANRQAWATNVLSAVSAGIALTAVIVTLLIQNPWGSRPTHAIVTAGGRTVCGVLATEADGSLSLTPAGGTSTPVDAGSTVSVVNSCP